jgi:glutamyl-tRNA synthetase
MQKLIRTRFAPSPTGHLHVGSLRTALYNYLFAKKNGGKFILRIEDTDQQRKVESAIENIIDTLEWTGINPDEGPGIGGEFGSYIQSERLEFYKKQMQILLEKGYAYPCFCSPERLRELRELQKIQGMQPGYDNRCRDLSAKEVERRKKSGEPYVIRLKLPLEGEVVINDLIHGEISFPCKQLDDQIIVKSDGFPTYHLANVVDDYYMQISHVIRGEEWLPSTPKHKLLYEYFGWETPQFAHLPLLLNPNRSKLSKRQGDVAVEDYRKQGYLPETLINFLTLLGWNPGSNREIFSLEELVEAFSLDNVGKSGSIFNLEKLKWMNGYYIRNKEINELFELAKPFFPKSKIWNDDKLKQILVIVRDSLSTLGEIPKKASFFFSEEVPYTELGVSEWIRTEGAKDVLKTLLEKIEKVENLDSVTFINTVKTVGKELGIKGKALWMPIRCALTGEDKGPEIHIIAEFFGKDICTKRIKTALEYAKKQAN